MREAAERKRRRYEELSDHFRFEPLAVETAGAYGESTTALMSEIGRSVTEATGESRETLWLEQRLGLAGSEAMRVATEVLMVLFIKFHEVKALLPYMSAWITLIIFSNFK